LRVLFFVVALVWFTFFVVGFCFGGTGVWTQGFALSKQGLLLLEPHFQPILFWRWSPMNYLPRLFSNLDPPDLSLPSS
jgi:hypothetical protein